ncbi:hypothetical protein V6Z11_A01G210600 [Gossypium hirsutum]
MLKPKIGSINVPLLSLFAPSHDLLPRIRLSYQLPSLFPLPSSHSHMLFIDATLRDCALNDKSQAVSAISTPNVIFASQKESLCPRRLQKKQKSDNRSYLNLTYEHLQQHMTFFFLFKGRLMSICTISLM